jgi:hypothetical protein
MKIKVSRYSRNNESTLGAFFIDGKFYVHTVEDEKREVKVMSETRIPEGTYSIELAKWGAHHEKYAKMFPEMHKGMLLLKDVPGFQGILIHIGNTDLDSSGCILVCNTVDNNKITRGTGFNSTEAYKRIYPQIAAAIEAKIPVTITVENIEKV